ncbi:bifunctional ADP-dependent NAD(P)H-hydrate dehydratase/NAD(P)H-hydrate epimerase, partial [Leclercia adecarboxylata]|uniref:NAD(P)H-hydrate dehydratase n=1 Tax=Leclercia adecarboxylata TaxID=83655 RepID=UPI00234C6920
MGQAPWGRGLLSLAAQHESHQVWDADALNLLAAGSIVLPAASVITPHPGEAARLLQCSVAEIQADRPAAARALARRYACVALGSYTHL